MKFPMIPFFLASRPSIMEMPDFTGPDDSFRSRLNSRLLDARTIVINDPVTAKTAGAVSEQLTVLAAESAEPIQIMMSDAPGGDVAAGLSTHDLIRSLDVPVTILGSGRITGAGLLAFTGVASDRRFALPHARFRVEAPTESPNEGAVSDLERQAEAAADRRRRVVALLAEATGQSEEQIDADLSSRRAFDAEAAAAYGLIERVVQSRGELP